MTLPTQTPHNEYTGTGAVTVFSFTFRVDESDDLAVYIDGVLQSSGYSISGLGVNSGGAITFTTAPASGVKVTLRREMPAARETDYQNAGEFRASTVNNDLDELWMFAQQLRRDLDYRALLFGKTETRTSEQNALPLPQTGSALAWASGGGIENQSFTLNTTTSTHTVLNFTTLKALDVSTLANGQVISVASGASPGDQKGGEFAWYSGDYSTQVSNDPSEGVYIPPNSDASGASGAFVRRFLGSPKLSWFVSGSGDQTDAFQRALLEASNTTGILIGDASCTVATSTTVTIPENVQINLFKTITQGITSDYVPMFTASNGSVINGMNKKGRLRGQVSSQSYANDAFLANSVSDAEIVNCDIRDFSGVGAYFVDADDCCAKYNKILDCGKSVTTNNVGDRKGGIYVNRCLNFTSERNDIRDPLFNCIKFRADNLGETSGCRSTGDRVIRAGFIGIANGKVQDHVITDHYALNCTDNGVDINGSNGAKIIGGTSRGCLDGVYMGENSMTNGQIIGVTCANNKRAGIGSLGSLTNCLFKGNILDGNGSGIYCSGLTGLEIEGGSITNSARTQYTDNENGATMISSGIGIYVQSHLSGAGRLQIHDVYFGGNAGKDIELSTGSVTDSQVYGNDLADSGGDGRINYGMNHYTFNYDNGSDAVYNGEALTWASGSGRLMRLTGDGVTGTGSLLWVTSGTAPADNDILTGGSSGDTIQVNGTPAASSTTTLTNTVIRDNPGLQTNFTARYTIASSGATSYTLNLPNTSLNTSYHVAAVVPDWITDYRQNPGVKTTTQVGLEFGTATPGTSRIIEVTINGLLPVV